MKQCSNLILSLFLVLILQSCSDKNGDSYVLTDRLVERNDTTYQVNSNTPFTGFGVDSVENVMTVKVEFQEGLKDGLYQEYYLNTQLKTEGLFKKGDRVKKWTEYYKNGFKMSEGEYVEDLKSGTWIMYNEKEVKEKEVSFENGFKQGFYKSYYQNGKKKIETKFSGGRLEGQFIEYKPDGDTLIYYNKSKSKLIFDEFQLGNEVSNYDFSYIYDEINDLGEEVFFHIDLSTHSEIDELESMFVYTYPYSVSGVYLDDSKVGTWVYSKYDDTEVIVNYEENKKNGEYIINYDGSDRVLIKGEYKNDSKTGLWKTFFPNGNLELKIEYKRDEPNGSFEKYYSDRQLFVKGKYERGTKVDVWETFEPEGWMSNKKIFYETNYRNYEYNRDGEVTNLITRIWYED